MKDQGYLADPTEFERLTGRKLHPKAWDLEPVGNRVFMLRDEVPEKIGSIIIPSGTRQAEVMGSGWVFGVGATVGDYRTFPAPHPGVPILEDPRELLCCHVITLQFAGKDIRLSLRDREYRGEVSVITDRDILAVDRRPERVPWDVE